MQIETTGLADIRPTMRSTSPINMSLTERRLSALGAVVLGIFAAKQRNAASVPLGAGSLALLYMSATGHNMINDILNRNTAVLSDDHAVSVPHQQGIHITESITINRSRADLYSYLRDVENLPRILSYLSEVRMLPD